MFLLYIDFYIDRWEFVISILRSFKAGPAPGHGAIKHNRSGGLRGVKFIIMHPAAQKENASLNILSCQVFFIVTLFSIFLNPLKSVQMISKTISSSLN